MKKTALFLSAAMLLTLLAAPASAASFTPSVEQKEAPAVTTVTDKSGNEAAALIIDAQGNEVAGVPVTDLAVTPVAKANQAGGQVSEALTRAYEQIKNASSLTEVAPQLEKALQTSAPDVKVSDLVVRDVFDVSVTGAAADFLAQEGNTITIRFDVKAAPGTALVVLHNYAGSDWEVISNDRVARNADGSVDVTFDSLSPIAFLVNSADVEVDPEGPTSPQTGDSGLPAAGIAVVLLGCAVLTGAYLVRKKYVAD